MKIGDEVMIHGYVDEIRKDCIIIRNEGGYFGTVKSEVYHAFHYDEVADTPQTECRTCKWAETSWTSHYCDDCKAHNKYEPNDTPQTDCSTCKFDDAEWYVNNCDECVCGNGKPSNYVPKQTDCPWK